MSRQHSRGIKHLRVHQCEVCDRYTSSGMMLCAGTGPHQFGPGRRRVYKWLCDRCASERENVQAINDALVQWEISRGLRAS